MHPDRQGSVSKAQRYRRSIANRAVLFLPFLAVLIAGWTQGTIGLAPVGSPAEWYFTAELVRTSLIETPFVLVRVSVPLLLVGSGVLLAGQLA